MTINEKALLVCDFIESTNIVTRFGSLCTNQTDKGLPIGVGLTPDCKGNIYSYDENEACTAYAYISDIRSTGNFSEVEVTLTVNVFSSAKQNGENMSTYTRAVELYNQMWKKYKNNVNLVTPSKANKFASLEFMSIEYSFRVFGSCEVPEFGDPICH